MFLLLTQRESCFIGFAVNLNIGLKQSWVYGAVLFVFDGTMESMHIGVGMEKYVSDIVLCLLTLSVHFM